MLLIIVKHEKFDHGIKNSVTINYVPSLSTNGVKTIVSFDRLGKPSVRQSHTVLRMVIKMGNWVVKVKSSLKFMVSLLVMFPQIILQQIFVLSGWNDKICYIPLFNIFTLLLFTDYCTNPLTSRLKPLLRIIL